ncbi:MAG: hypothetical protein E6K63_13620 [Nitrospirae bacterium]|nr:MAG: hypothetical protein E6K63_13620 [Nitrospirota bacterium]
MIPRKLAAAFGVTRLTLLSSVFLLVLLPNVALAGPYFEDGYLGLTQSELREKLGPPHAVRDRKAALRVFNYYSFSDWDNYYRKLISPQNGEDVYKYTREGIEVRYSFSYFPDPKDDSDSPTLYVKLVDIEFSPSIPIERIPALVPEFRPSAEPTVPSFRSNIWVLLFKGPPVSEARFIVRERGKERLDWSLAFQIFSLQGLPEFLTLQSRVDRMEISAQSIQMVKERQRLTHEPILNPFSKEFANQAAPPPPPTKKIPVPKYAD